MVIKVYLNGRQLEALGFRQDPSIKCHGRRTQKLRPSSKIIPKKDPVVMAND